MNTIPNLDNVTRNLVGYTVFITKSKAGHYTVAIREKGTWTLNGYSYKLTGLVFKENFINTLEKAREIAAAKMATLS